MNAYNIINDYCGAIMASICARLWSVIRADDGDQSGDSAYEIVNLTKAVTPKGQFVRLRPHAILAAVEAHCQPIASMVFCQRTHQKQTFGDEDARARYKARPSPRATDGRKVGVRRHHRCT